METVDIKSDKLKCNLYMDKFAYESDGVILVNRIKPHTGFHGDRESGICKMAVIGLGKHAQALEIHKYGVEGLKTLTFKAAEELFATGKILMGIGIVEDALDKTSIIKAFKVSDILKGEAKLLKAAKSKMPSLPVEDVDVLIVDQIGKNISGTGLDTNIIGRMMIAGEREPETPRIKCIILSDLTLESHGNAVGVGLGDVITKKLFDKINYQATYENVYTSTFIARAKIPYVAKDEVEALKVAKRSAVVLKDDEARIIRIKDTLHLGEMLVSKAIFDEIKDRVECLESEIELYS